PPSASTSRPSVTAPSRGRATYSPTASGSATFAPVSASACVNSSTVWERAAGSRSRALTTAADTAAHTSGSPLLRSWSTRRILAVRAGIGERLREFLDGLETRRGIALQRSHDDGEHRGVHLRIALFTQLVDPRDLRGQDLLGEPLVRADEEPPPAEEFPRDD